MVYWRVFRSQRCRHCNTRRMQLLAWCLVCDSGITSPKPCDNCIGFRSNSESSLLFKLCLLIHDIQNGRCPNYLVSTVMATSTHNSRPGLRSASAALNTLPRLRTVMGERSFSFAGPEAWNSLSDQLHTVESTPSFKRQLKTHFFNVSFRQ